eukprot:2964456-Pyramimonas_sp.AAC.1
MHRTLSVMRSSWRASSWGRSFVLKFQGAGAERRAGAAVAAMRTAAGQWCSFNTTDPSGRPVTLSVSVDKDRQDIAREIACKKVRHVFSAKPGRPVYVDRDEGVLSVMWGAVSKSRRIPRRSHRSN